MKTIVESLLTEHTLIRHLFDEIDRLLPGVHTVAEVRLLARLVEGVLSHHADVEENLAFAALDHVLAQKGELKCLYQDHEEIDSHLRSAALATDFAEALQLLKAGLKASREHFNREEQTVFPLFEKLFPPTLLEALGAATSAKASPPLGPHFLANALLSRLRHYTPPPAA